MAQPSTRQELIDYVLRKLGAPVLEINVAQEQIEDLVDDAVQFFQERHFDGVIQTYLKYEVTQEDIDRGKARPPGKGGQSAGITTETATTSIVGTATTFTYYENSNYLAVPPSIIGINKVWQFDGISTINSPNMFNVKYQMFLNDIYYWGNMDMLSYSMAMSYLETMNFLLDTHKQVRFNQRQDRLYLDVDFGQMNSLTLG